MRVNKMHLLLSHIDAFMEGRLLCYYANSRFILWDPHVKSN